MLVVLTETYCNKVKYSHVILAGQEARNLISRLRCCKFCQRPLRQFDSVSESSYYCRRQLSYVGAFRKNNPNENQSYKSYKMQDIQGRSELKSNSLLKFQCTLSSHIVLKKRAPESRITPNISLSDSLHYPTGSNILSSTTTIRQT